MENPLWHQRDADGFVIDHAVAEVISQWKGEAGPSWSDWPLPETRADLAGTLNNNTRTKHSEACSRRTEGRAGMSLIQDTGVPPPLPIDVALDLGSGAAPVPPPTATMRSTASGPWAGRVRVAARVRASLCVPPLPG
ncbi:hypothetical protein AAFF_G00283880 [Aldrovandia affinis]|uniref:Uncharacterized protein n=1 Tax=Aldrovandia affinis TaxID=143900 RepID=A0AAD7X132_9TELE|nr:hypothetical protein AAFF_G00283880 [Aldrovandia affinis]